MTRRWVWLQILAGWIPAWILFTLLVSPVNPIHRGGSAIHAAVAGLAAIVPAALLGFGVQYLTRRIPWPHPFRLGFMLLHLGGAVAYAGLWYGATHLFQDALLPPAIESGSFLLPSLVLGVWFYVMVAGVSYATRATERAARAETVAAESQLAALRAQLHPHFLFNALHTVVQLIPREPKRAAQAAEQLAALLRATIEGDRDVVTLGEERAFVERYLEIERIRYGDRLRLDMHLPDEIDTATLPSFTLQTLVENAVRHGVAPRVEATEVRVRATRQGRELRLEVRDSGPGAEPGAVLAGPGTGLRRLRERLAALYDGRTRLEIETAPGAGFTATLVIPQDREDEP